MLKEDVSAWPVAAELETALPGAIVNGKVEHRELTLWIDPARIREVCSQLKHAQTFVRLSSITAVDWHPSDPRFEIVYHLHSLDRNQRVRLKCSLSEGAEIDSVSSVWRTADWYEREVFDLFGVTFRDHPNLRRILMPDDWEGYPLRKDYPVHGFKYNYPQE